MRFRIRRTHAAGARVMKGTLTTDQDRLWVYATVPIVVFLVAGTLAYGTYFALAAVRPEVTAALPGGQVTFGLYLLIAVVEWSLAASIILRLRRAGGSAIDLIVSRGDPARFKWLPAALMFVGTNAIMGLLMVTLAGLEKASPGFSYYEGLRLWQSLLLVVVVTVSAAFCEELIWRGYVITRLEARGRRRGVAVLLSAVLFALIHSPLHWPFTFLYGLLAGYYYGRERNLIPLMITHAFVNLWTFGWFLILR
jgi:membrane protease YdiL (CAAX protease family)